VVDSGWTSGGFSAEIIAKVVEQLPVNCLNNPPVRIALPDAPAPTSRVLEKAYYTKTEDLVEATKKIIKLKNYDN
jgi:pyruvate dehydrogenase E1 component beta subunit